MAHRHEAPSARPQHGRSSCYWPLALLWVLLVPPLTYLAGAMLDGVFYDLRLVGDEAALPMLTQWYRNLGTTGLHALTALTAAVGTLLIPWRAQRFAVWVAGLGLVTGICLAFGGMVAAHIAYVKLCV